ncbi:ABC transporter permease [Paenibacillus sp. 22594]|uniref:ABC transporter permease n=1 Tax=Paenibacillus sp. 22594 TaxID=3453947 RepID=UPI003F87660B
MRTLAIELKKCKRSGVIPIMFAVGILGALYAFVNFFIRKETLFSLPLPPMVILLTSLYGMIMVLNLFGVIVAACMIYNIEHSGNAIKKMYMLPIKVANIYLSKFLIMAVLLAICSIFQNAALAWIGMSNLPKGVFEIHTFFRFASYTFLTTLPVMSFMLIISSRFENMWSTLGIGVAGFLSGMTLAMGHSKWLLINPFVLMMKPAVSPTVNLDYTVVALSVIETVLFFMAGLIMTKHIRYE